MERFAQLESILRRTLWLLLFADPVAARVFTVGASTSELIKRSRMILNESSRKGIERGQAGLLLTLTDAHTAIDKRSDLLHNVQLPDENFNRWKYVRGQDEPKIIPAGISELLALESEVNGVINRLLGEAPEPPFEMPDHYL